MRISISMCLRQHLLHIQSSSLKLRHMFKFNTQRSTITGSECETFGGTENRLQSAVSNQVRKSNHFVTVTWSNTHIWICRFSHTLASLQLQQTRTKLHISSQTSIRTHSSLWTVHTSLCFTIKNKSWRRNSRIHEVHWRWSMTRSSKLRYHNSPQFPFPTFSFCNIWRGTRWPVVSQIPFNVPIMIVFNVTA